MVNTKSKSPEERLAAAVVLQWVNEVQEFARHKKYGKVCKLGEWLETDSAKFWCEAAGISLVWLKQTYRETQKNLKRNYKIKNIKIARRAKKTTGSKRASALEKSAPLKRASRNENSISDERAIALKRSTVGKRTMHLQNYMRGKQAKMSKISTRSKCASVLENSKRRERSWQEKWQAIESLLKQKIEGGTQCK